MRRGMRAAVLGLGAGVLGLISWPAPAMAGEVAVGESVVVWEEGLERLGREVASLLPRVQEEVAARLGLPQAREPARVVVVSGHAAMTVEVTARVPAWAVGVAVASRGLVVIRADLLGSGVGGGLGPVLRHECVHLAWGRYAGARRRALPLWAEEGVAEEVGGGVSVDAGASLDLAAAFGRLIPFVELETAFPPDARGADLAYKQSRSWVRFLVKEVGWDVLRAMLADVGRGDGAALSFEGAVLEHTGQSLGSWHAGWRQHVEEEARPWFHLVLRDFPGLLLTCLALVSLVAWFVLRRRRRRQILLLPDEPDPLAEGRPPAGGP